MIGEKFGNLEVVGVGGYRQEPSGHRRQLVIVQCKCGEEYETVYLYLKRKNGTRSCRECAYKTIRTVQIGDKFDKLTVCDYTKTKRLMAVCKCDCGTENVVVRPELLKINSTNNCGCAPRGLWTGFGKMSTTFFGKIKRNAKVRGLDFKLNGQYLWHLFEQQGGKCALSGLPIDFSIKTTDKNTASLDRIDSNKGYIVDNVWWVHKDINLMKFDLELDRFVLLCKMVTEKNS